VNLKKLMDAEGDAIKGKPYTVEEYFVKGSDKRIELLVDINGGEHHLLTEDQFSKWA